MTNQEAPPVRTESSWQKLPAVIVAIFHALAGITATGVLFASNDPGAGAAAGGSSAVAVLTSIILASHMFAPASVRRISGYVNLVDAVAPKVVTILDQIKATMDTSAPVQLVQGEPLVAPAPPVAIHVYTSGSTNSQPVDGAQNAPEGPAYLDAQPLGEPESLDTKMGQAVDESPAG